VRKIAPIVEDLKREILKLQTRRDELQTEIKDQESTRRKYRDDLKFLRAEILRESTEICIADCLSEILLSKPYDVEILYTYVSSLKRLANGTAPDLVHNKPIYEAEVRNLMRNSLLEYFKEDLTPREEVTELEGNLKKKTQAITTLTSRLEDMERLQQENEELKTKVGKLEEQLQSYANQWLADPTIKPEDTKLPL
jgi:predicted  nucleic acid-binding Zn-ribbon protein